MNFLLFPHMRDAIPNKGVPDHLTSSYIVIIVVHQIPLKPSKKRKQFISLHQNHYLPSTA